MKQHAKPGRSVWLVLACTAGLLAGCAKVNDTGLRLVSTKVDAYLIVNNQLLNGSVLLVPDRTGRVSFAAEKGAISSCSGAMRYTATQSADIDLQCTDGTQVALKATLISDTRGYGYGSTAQGPASVVFGLPEPDARALLSVPPGKTLAPNAESGSLELQ
jgi:hypothetical protein